jgi:hypothetical protein
MDMNAFLSLLLASDNPLLPHPAAMRLALHGVWALVLGGGACLLSGKLARPYRLGTGLFVMAWTLLPGPVSPAYWLGLAFQTPSLTSAVLGLVWLVKAYGWPLCARNDEFVAFDLLAAAGVVLGWVLLLDTLALLPVSVYAWGFSPAALGVVAVLTALLWAMCGMAEANQVASDWAGPALILLVLALFVLTRLPTGNVWDALIDPWLWLGLQVRWLLNAVRDWRAKRCLPPAIPA